LQVSQAIRELSWRQRLAGTALPPHVDARHHQDLCRAVGSTAGLGLFVPVALPLLCVVGAWRVLLLLLASRRWLAFFIGIAVVSVFFPPAGVIAIIAVLYLLKRRIDYLSTHRSVIWFGVGLYSLAGIETALAGLALQALPLLLAGGPTTWACAGAGALLVGLGTYFLIGVYVDRELRTFYDRGYNTEQVLSIATTVPFIVLLLLLAIFGMVIEFGVDAGVEVAPEGGPGAGDVAPEGFGEGAGVPRARAGVPEAPGTIEIGPYIRSNADGIVENNLSYEGVRLPGTPEPSGYHQVGGHLRTQPDGIVENNLSYRGPTAEASTEPDEGRDG
jgi:hypothetical protein